MTAPVGDSIKLYAVGELHCAAGAEAAALECALGDDFGSVVAGLHGAVVGVIGLVGATGVGALALVADERVGVPTARKEAGVELELVSVVGRTAAG